MEYINEEKEEEETETDDEKKTKEKLETSGLSHGVQQRRKNDNQAPSCVKKGRNLTTAQGQEAIAFGQGRQRKSRKAAFSALQLRLCACVRCGCARVCSYTLAVQAAEAREKDRWVPCVSRARTHTHLGANAQRCESTGVSGPR